MARVDLPDDVVAMLREIVATAEDGDPSVKAGLRTLDDAAAWAIRFALKHDCETQLAHSANLLGKSLVLAVVPPEEGRAIKRMIEEATGGTMTRARRKRPGVRFH